MSDLSLTHYNPKKDIIVASDTSNLDLGDMILHKESNGQAKVIVQASRTLSPAEKGTAKSKKRL